MNQIVHERYLYSSVTKESTFNINSEFLEEDIRYIIDNDIRRIAASVYSGYALNNIEKICQLKFLESFGVNLKNGNLRGIEKLENLKELGINGSVLDADLSNLIKLKSLYFVYSKKQMGFSNLINLENISVSKADQKYLNEDVFSGYQQLSNLEIVQSTIKNGLGFLQKSKTLTCLELHFVKDEINLKDLLPLKKSLKEIRIGNSRHIVGHDSLNEFKNLEILVISHCNPVPDSSFVNGLNNLKQITVIGSSFFEDGKIENLKKEGLTVGIDNKRNYNLKSSQFMNYFKNPPEPMP